MSRLSRWALVDGGGVGFAWIGYWSLAIPIAGRAALFVAALRAPATGAR